MQPPKMALILESAAATLGLDIKLGNMYERTNTKAAERFSLSCENFGNADTSFLNKNIICFVIINNT